MLANTSTRGYQSQNSQKPNRETPRVKHAPSDDIRVSILVIVLSLDIPAEELYLNALISAYAMYIVWSYYN